MSYICDYISVFELIAFYFLCAAYFSPKYTNKYLKLILFVTLLVILIAVMMRKITLFYDLLIIDKMQLSLNSTPFSMYFNSAKVICALSICLIGRIFVLEKNFDK